MSVWSTSVVNVFKSNVASVSSSIVCSLSIVTGESFTGSTVIVRVDILESELSPAVPSFAWKVHVSTPDASFVCGYSGFGT